MNKQFIKFIFFSGIAASVNILSRIFFNIFTNYEFAIIMAFFVALTTAFVFNKFFVFGKSRYKNWMIEYWFFFLVNIVGLIQTIGISMGLTKFIFTWVNFVFYPDTIAHATGVAFPVLTSFVGHKYLSFKKVETK